MDILEPADLKPLVESDFRLGDNQYDSDSAGASHDVREYFSLSESGVEVGIMSFDFPATEWENEDWIKWLKMLNKELRAKTKVVGGPKVQARDVLQGLIDEEVIEFRLLDESETFHILYADNPKQVWIEEYHSYGAPRGVHYTAKPYEAVWDILQNLFKKVWERGKSVESLGEETIEDVNPTHLIVGYLQTHKHKKVEAQVFYSELKEIADKLHSARLARDISFVPDPLSKYWSRAISESLGDLLSFDFIRTSRMGKKLFYELTSEGKKLPEHYSETPAWKTLAKYSSFG